MRLLRDIEGELPKEKPPLHAIAAMPFPLSMAAMRKFYDKDWRKPEHDGETHDKWKVRVHYSYREEETWIGEVDAACEEEAKEKAVSAFDTANGWLDDCDIDDVEVEFVGESA